MTEMKTLFMLFAERPGGGGSSQWRMQREAAGQTVSRPVWASHKDMLFWLVLYIHVFKTQILTAMEIPHKNDSWFVLVYFKSSLLSFFPLPSRLVSALTLLSKKLNCYKITLECAPKNVAFYQKFGYSASDETYMQCRFSDWGQQLWTSLWGHGPRLYSPTDIKTLHWQRVLTTVFTVVAQRSHSWMLMLTQG